MVEDTRGDHPSGPSADVAEHPAAQRDCSWISVVAGKDRQTKALASKTQLVSAFARFSKWFGGAKATREFMSQ